MMSLDYSTKGRRGADERSGRASATTLLIGRHKSKNKKARLNFIVALIALGAVFRSISDVDLEPFRHAIHMFL